ncbi:hypothetical protein G7Y89_g3215 [Cudoniella acicularis]|uniref:Uncharacterized protein n=1 Tax=Cudoniella acicularis TaxID=354080 RepID=A0A8H4W668_9HELO|nr:hypothetical protein G7Y89_g3215 [Cudoniella acicularis]
MAILSSILSAFARKPPGPPIVATDTIVPIHSEDDNSRHRGYVMNLFVRFDDVLNVEKLQQSLFPLLKRPGWNKLSGRLRLNSKGTIECHTPTVFDAKRPQADWYHEAYAVNLAEHSLASRLPRASSAQGIPQLVENTADFYALMHKPGDPQVLQDWLQSDRPGLGVHVVTFTDATLITLRFSHLLADKVTLKSLFKAWSLVLQGREAELPPVYGVETSLLEKLGADQKAPYGLTDKLLIAYMKALRDAALLDLEDDKSEDGKPPFVSEGDVLLAWWARLLIPNVSTSAKQTVGIINVLELRSFLVAARLFPKGSAYIANAHSLVPAFLPAGELLTSSLGHGVGVMRRALATLTTQEQVEALMALQRATPKDMFVLGDAGMTMVVGTNWTKAKMYDIDFSQALEREGPHSAGQRAGRPSLVYSHSIQPLGWQNFLIKIIAITGKDADGNYWLYGNYTKKTWAQIDQAIKKEASELDN